MLENKNSFKRSPDYKDSVGKEDGKGDEFEAKSESQEKIKELKKTLKRSIKLDDFGSVKKLVEDISYYENIINKHKEKYAEDLEKEGKNISSSINKKNFETRKWLYDRYGICALSNEIALTPDEISDKTKVYVGELEEGIFKKIPKSIEHIFTSPDREIHVSHVTIGEDYSIGDFINKLEYEQDIYITESAKVLMNNIDKVSEHKKKQLTLVAVKGTDLGFVQYNRFGSTQQTELRAFYKEAEKFGLELCPPEVALSYTDFSDSLEKYKENLKSKKDSHLSRPSRKYLAMKPEKNGNNIFEFHIDSKAYNFTIDTEEIDLDEYSSLPISKTFLFALPNQLGTKEEKDRKEMEIVLKRILLMKEKKENQTYNSLVDFKIYKDKTFVLSKRSIAEDKSVSFTFHDDGTATKWTEYVDLYVTDNNIVDNENEDLIILSSVKYRERLTNQYNSWEPKIIFKSDKFVKILDIKEEDSRINVSLATEKGDFKDFIFIKNKDGSIENNTNS